MRTLLRVPLMFHMKSNKARKFPTALACFVLAGCNMQDDRCPDHMRQTLLPARGAAGLDGDIRIDDCMVEYIGGVASSNADIHSIVSAAIAYCGTYDPSLSSPRETLQAQERYATMVVVSDRAFKCPPARKRDVNDNLPG